MSSSMSNIHTYTRRDITQSTRGYKPHDKKIEEQTNSRATTTAHTHTSCRKQETKNTATIPQKQEITSPTRFMQHPSAMR